MKSRIIINFNDGVPGEVTFESADSEKLAVAMVSVKCLREAVLEAMGMMLNLDSVNTVDLLNDIAVRATQYQVRKESLNKKD